MANRRCNEYHEALASGNLTYFTGKPCKHGHIAPRLTSTQVCTQCGKEIHQVTDRDNYRYKNTFYRQFLSRQQAAKRNNIPFTIKFEDIEQVQYCPILGIKLNYGRSGLNRRDDAKASIDKVIPELGYVPGNVFVISWRANKLKGDMTLQELTLIMQYIKDKTHG